MEADPVTRLAIGLELSTDADMAAIAVAGRGRRAVDWRISRSTGRRMPRRRSAPGCHEQLRTIAGVFADPMPCAGILDDLRAAGVWLHLLAPRMWPRRRGSSRRRSGAGG